MPKTPNSSDGHGSTIGWCNLRGKSSSSFFDQTIPGLDLKNGNMMSNHDIRPKSEMRIAFCFDIAGKGSEIEHWKGRAIQPWKSARNSI
jgi:hypothetical protein